MNRCIKLLFYIPELRSYIKNFILLYKFEWNEILDNVYNGINSYD